MQNVPEKGEMSPEDMLRKIADLRLSIIRLRQKLNGPEKKGKDNYALSLQLQKNQRRLASLEAALPKPRLVEKN